MKKCLLLLFFFTGYFQTVDLWAAISPGIEIVKSKPTRTAVSEIATNKKTQKRNKHFFNKKQKVGKQKEIFGRFKKLIKRLFYWTDRFTENFVAQGGALAILLPIIGFIFGFYILLPIAYIAAIFTMIFAVKMRRAGNNSRKVQFGFSMALVILFFGTMLLAGLIVLFIHLRNSEP